MSPATRVTIFNWSLEIQNAQLILSVLLLLQYLIEKQIIHALVWILLWKKQIK